MIYFYPIPFAFLFLFLYQYLSSKNIFRIFYDTFFLLKSVMKHIICDRTINQCKIFQWTNILLFHAFGQPPTILVTFFKFSVFWMLSIIQVQKFIQMSDLVKHCPNQKLKGNFNVQHCQGSDTFHFLVQLVCPFSDP